MSIKEERKDLEKLIQDRPDNLEKSTAPTDDEGLKSEPSFQIDVKKIKRNCQRRARRTIKNATGLMLSDHMVSENPYLKNKMQVDIISLSGLLYQLEVNEIMQESLVEEVRAGAAHPRMYEVFGNLSKTIGELNKQLIQTVEAIKSTYKDVKIDIQDKEDELKAIGPGEAGISRTREGGLLSLGSKNLIKEANKLKAQKAADLRNEEAENIEDIEDIEDIEEIKE